MEWADAFVWRSVLGAEQAVRDEIVQGKLRHLHRTQQIFFKVWASETVSYEKVEHPFLEERTLAESFHSAAQVLLSNETDLDLARDLIIPWGDHFARAVGKERAQRTTRGESFYQLVAHTTYHRGQVTMRLRQLDETPPLVDYIAWIWLGRPAPEWPE